MTTTAERVNDAIREAAEASLPQSQKIDFDAVLTSDVGLDSVQIMDLVMEIEDRLDISVPVEVLAEVQTLGQLSQHLQQLIEGKR
ncbi:MAG: acyl carrier protein [Wenzhouxiangellaceae bacterium]